MTTTDVQQLQYALSKAQERNEELQAQLKEAQAHATTLVDIVIEHEATIQKLSFERDALTGERQVLTAKLDAVPVGAISGLIFGNDDDDIFSDKYIASTNAVAAWLETEVTA